MSAEAHADPHGIQWIRGVPPIDAHLYATADFPVADLAAVSTTRGTGGRRASGFRAVEGGTLVFVTGGGSTETWVLQAGEGDTIEMTSITSYSGATIRVYW